MDRFFSIFCLLFICCSYSCCDEHVQLSLSLHNIDSEITDIINGSIITSQHIDNKNVRNDDMDQHHRLLQTNRHAANHHADNPTLQTKYKSKQSSTNAKPPPQSHLRSQAVSSSYLHRHQHSKHEELDAFPQKPTLTLISSASHHSIHHLPHNTSSNHTMICRRKSIYAPQRIPVYYVNLDDSVKRRMIFTRQLTRLGFDHQYRIKARLPSAKDVSVKIMIQPLRDNEPKETACIVSHLIAIHTAIYDEKEASYPYALITEDDVLFELDVNYTALAMSAPSDFGILQLMSSNAQETENNYDLYMKTLSKQSIGYKDVAALGWTRWAVDKGLWSTQAYMIHKAHMKSFIDNTISYDNTSSSYHITIINPSPKLFPCNVNMMKRGFLCDFPYRIVADYYLYLGAGSTYFSQIPIFNGAKVESTIHTRSSKTHAVEFDHIGRTIQRARDDKYLLPSFIKPFICHQQNSSFHQSNHSSSYPRSNQHHLMNISSNHRLT